MSDNCLTLICSPEIEEQLLDTLLIAVDGAVFTSTPTFSHGTAHGRLSDAEKVMGRSRTVQIQIIVATNELSSLLDTLRHRFRGAGLRYWAVPLHIEGEIA